MRIHSTLTDAAVLHELGSRFTQLRLDRNLTQADLAARAGVGRATVQRLEAGESVQLTRFLRVLRALDALDGLDELVPEPGPSPMQLLQHAGRRRRRAGRPRAGTGPSADEPWTWADEPADER